MRNKEKGFTLIELLVVVLILGILMAIAIPSYLSLTTGGRQKSVESNISIALTDESAYSTEYSAYGTVGSSPPISAIDAGINWASSLSGGTGTNKVIYAGTTTSGSSSAVVVGALGADGKYYWAEESQNLALPGPFYIVDTSGTAPPTATFTSSGYNNWSAAGGSALRAVPLRGVGVRCRAGVARRAPLLAGAVLLTLTVVTHLHCHPADGGQLVASFDALLSGRLGSVYTAQTNMTSPPGMVLLAAPVVAVMGGPAHGSELILAVASLAFLTFGALRLLRRLCPDAPASIRIAMISLVVLGAPSADGLWAAYHPEDLVACAFLLLAVAEVGGGRDVMVGLLLGVAVLTRQWVIPAAVPLVLASGPSWRRVTLAGVGLCAVVLTPFALLEPGGLLRALEAPSTATGAYSVWSQVRLSPVLRYTLGRLGPLVATAGTAVVLDRRWRRRSPDISQIVGAVALVAGYRVVLDPAVHGYYDLPAFLLLAALAAKEARGHQSVRTAVVVLVAEMLWELQALCSSESSSDLGARLTARETGSLAGALLLVTLAALVVAMLATIGHRETVGSPGEHSCAGGIGR